MGLHQGAFCPTSLCLSLFLLLSIPLMALHRTIHSKGLFIKPHRSPEGPVQTRAAGIEVKGAGATWGFFLSDDEALQGFLWHPRLSRLCLMTKPCLRKKKLQLKDFLFLRRFLSMTRQNLWNCLLGAHICILFEEEEKIRKEDVLFCFVFFLAIGRIVPYCGRVWRSVSSNLQGVTQIHRYVVFHIPDLDRVREVIWDDAC